MVPSKNIYPITIKEKGVNERPFERMLRRFIWATFSPIFPDYVSKQKLYFSAPGLRFDEEGMYGTVLWRLPDHSICWERIISIQDVGRRAYVLRFEAENMNSKQSKDRISAIRFTASDGGRLIQVLLNEDIAVLTGKLTK